MNDPAFNSQPYGDGSSDLSTSSDPLFVTVFVGMMIVFAIIGYVINAFFLAMVFKKAGVNSWKAWVPVYNQWVFLELGGQKGWISLLFIAGLIPLLGIIPALIAVVYSCIAAYNIGLNFGKEGIFVLLYICLGLVWSIWLAVDETAVWKPHDSSILPPQNPTPPSQPASV